MAPPSCAGAPTRSLANARLSSCARKSRAERVSGDFPVLSLAAARVIKHFHIFPRFRVDEAFARGLPVRIHGRISVLIAPALKQGSQNKDRTCDQCLDPPEAHTQRA